MPEHLSAARRYLDRRVHASTGEYLGRVSDVLSDARSMDPQWLVVRLRGILPRHRPLPIQLVLDEERNLVTPITAEMLQRAPVAEIATDLGAEEEIGWRRYWASA